ncbi:MAG: type II secretion system F family protein [Candidatus Micrarchaeota archaeon]|nr:type II secretion system F family protein [Candidatus Micrarchaeota archaeon]
MAIRYERLISRNLARHLSDEIDLAGVKTTVDNIVRLGIFGSVAMLVIVSALTALAGLEAFIAFGLGILGAALFNVLIYAFLEYRVEQRKSQMEAMLPDYLQITSANLRSGIALDRAMLLAARPEFKFLSDDIKDMNKRVFSGENFDVALKNFASGYRSYQLNHAIRMMLEALRYGGAMSDLLDQISKDLRNQQLIQKEVAGQMFMYSIFIAFAGLIAAPVLYGLTSQMISVTDTVWKGILQANPGGLPTTGISFLKPQPPQISTGTYFTFAIAAIAMITGFASLIMSAISSGRALRGLRYMPVFIGIGIVIFLVMRAVVSGLFTGIGGGA